jgi:hypothetical protein
MTCLEDLSRPWAIPVILGLAVFHYVPFWLLCRKMREVKMYRHRNPAVYAVYFSALPIIAIAGMTVPECSGYGHGFEIAAAFLIFAQWVVYAEILVPTGVGGGVMESSGNPVFAFPILGAIAALLWVGISYGYPGPVWMEPDPHATHDHTNGVVIMFILMIAVGGGALALLYVLY